MEKVEQVKQLEEKYKEVSERPGKFLVESEVEIDLDAVENYETLTDEQKEEYTAEQRAAIEKYLKIVEETDTELEEINKQIEETVKKAHKAVEFDIKFNEEKIAENEKLIAEMETEIQNIEAEISAKEKEIEELKSREDYDEAELKALEAELKSLQSSLETKQERYKEKVEANNKVKEKLENLKEAKAQLEEDYPDIINPVREEQETQNPEGQEENHEYSDDDNQEQKSGERGQGGNGYPAPGGGSPAPGGGSPAPGNDSPAPSDKKDNNEKTEADEPKIDPTERFDELYCKAKKGTLTDKDYNDLVEIMSNPENYEKCGITTGVIFNKSKTILMAMAKMAGDSNTLSKEGREKMGIPVDKPDKENGLMSRRELMSWKGLKKLVDNPDGKIAAEEQFEKIVAMDRETLTPEQQEVWDKAQAHLNKYAGLRNALDVYQQVTQQRAEKSKSWFRKLGKKDKQELPAPSDNPASPGPGGEEKSDFEQDLEDGVYPPEENGQLPPPSSETKEEPAI